STSAMDTDINTNSGATGGVAGLAAIFAAKVAVPGFNAPVIRQGAAAFAGGVPGAQGQNAFQTAKDIGTLTDALVNGVTTYAGLIALFATQDSTLSGSERSSFDLPV